MTALRLVTLVGFYGVVLTVPMAAASMLAVRFRVRHPTLLAASAMGGLVLHGSIVFWAFYFLNGSGRYVGLALMILEVGSVAALLIVGRWAAMRPIVPLGVPVAALLVFTLFILSFGFVRGGIEEPVSVASSRFLPGLPIDNAIPLILSQAVDSDLRPLPDPLYANWSSSDRPPLQSGIHLSMTSPLAHERSELHYSVASSLLQSFWVVGLWAFFASARTTRPLVAVTTAAILFSGFTLLNTLYVWPKLLSAAYLLIVAAVFLTPATRSLQARRGCSILVGLSVAGAMLAHAGAVIPLLALAIFLLIRKQMPPRRFIADAVLVAALVVAPWIAYQKFVNPPGDRLLKLNVAGIADIETRRSLLQETVDHYRQVGISGSVANKLANVAEPFRGAASTAKDSWHIAESKVPGGGSNQTERDQRILDLRANQFFRLVPTLGMLVVGPILLGLILLLRNPALPAREVDMRLEWSLVLFLGLTIVVWSIVLFGPRYTVLHAGSYLTPILAFVFCTAACWKVSPAGTVGLVVLQSAAVLYLYKDIPMGAPQSLFAGGGLAMVALAVLSLVASIALLVIGFAERFPPEFGSKVLRGARALI